MAGSKIGGRSPCVHEKPDGHRLWNQCDSLEKLVALVPRPLLAHMHPCSLLAMGHPPRAQDPRSVLASLAAGWQWAGAGDRRGTDRRAGPCLVSAALRRLTIRG